MVDSSLSTYLLKAASPGRRAVEARQSARAAPGQHRNPEKLEVFSGGFMAGKNREIGKFPEI